MRLSSSAFEPGSAIPRRFTCDGEDLSPPLEWSEVPAGARSFALTCDDPDAPGGTWHHWAIYDIAAGHSGLAEAVAPHDARSGFEQAINDFRRPGYGGPCPPRGHGPHRYRFRLLALSIDHLKLPKQPSCAEVARAAQQHALAEATLVGVYERRK